MEIITRNPNDLRPHKLNRLPRWSRESEEWLAFVDDIAANGVQKPLDITEDNQVVDGETRRLAAIAAGQTSVPCRIVSGDHVEEIILRELSLRRNIRTKGQMAYLAIPLLIAAARTGVEKRGENLKNPNVFPKPHSVRDREESFAATCQKWGFAERLGEQASQIHRILSEHPDKREAVEASLFDAEKPAGLGGLLAWLGSEIADERRERDHGIKHGGGRPEAVERQLMLFSDVVKTAVTRWEYWKRFSDVEKRAHWQEVTKHVAALPPEDRSAMADYYATLAKRCRQSIGEAA